MAKAKAPEQIAREIVDVPVDDSLARVGGGRTDVDGWMGALLGPTRPHRPMPRMRG